jgi:hypothetical protein
MKKRLFALLLALCLLALFAVPSFAAFGDETVAKLYLCHRWSGPPSLGHVWVYIENRSNRTLQVGAYSLPPNQGVSLGNFGLTRSDGNGTYYNVEAYCAQRYSTSGTISNSTNLNQSELNRVSDAILQQNLWLPLGSNCADFACRVWNAGGGAHVTSAFGLPVFVKWQILAHGDEGNVRMYSPARDQVYKQSGSGGGASLHVCADGTVSKQIG